MLRADDARPDDTPTPEVIQAAFATYPSEYEPESQLHLPRIVGGGEGAELAVGLLAVSRIEHRGGIDRRELGVVENVKRRGAQLKMQPLIDCDVLDQRQIPIVDARAPEDIGRRVAQRAHRREPKNAGVEILRESALIFGQNRVAHYIYARRKACRSGDV